MSRRDILSIASLISAGRVWAIYSTADYDAARARARAGAITARVATRSYNTVRDDRNAPGYLKLPPFHWPSSRYDDGVAREDGVPVKSAPPACISIPNKQTDVRYRAACDSTFAIPSIAFPRDHRIGNSRRNFSTFPLHGYDIKRLPMCLCVGTFSCTN